MSLENLHHAKHDQLKAIRLESGLLPSYAWPGGYPIFYFAADGGILCPNCANSYKPGTDNEEQLRPVQTDVNYEDPALFCENCSQRIPSAYSEDEVVR